MHQWRSWILQKCKHHGARPELRTAWTIYKSLLYTSIYLLAFMYTPYAQDKSCTTLYTKAINCCPVAKSCCTWVGVKPRLKLGGYAVVEAWLQCPLSATGWEFCIPANSPEFWSRLPIVQMLFRISRKVASTAERLVFFFNHTCTSVFPAATVAVLRKSTRHHTFSSL